MTDPVTDPVTDPLDDRVRLTTWPDGACPRPVLAWTAGPGWRMAATTVVGGGVGERSWWLDATVAEAYHHPDPARHALEIAAALGFDPGVPGVAMLTAADVAAWCSAEAGGVRVAATVGLGWPVWAARSEAGLAAETDPRPPFRRDAVPAGGRIGTINILAVVPAALSDAALLNALTAATEAKTQALVEAGVPGTGTSSDAVCVAGHAPSRGAPGREVGEDGLYGGPRSVWGARLARAVHAAVAEGTHRWVATHAPGWSPAR